MRKLSFRLLRYWKLLSFRKLLYLPHILNSQEKRLVIFLALAILVSGGGLITRLFLTFTIPVPKVAGEYIEGALKEPRTINPLYAGQDADLDLTRLVFSGLLTYSSTGEILPDLAEKYEISPDGKTYTVFLKHGVRWQDGAELDAEDIVFTIKTIQNPQYKSVLHANWQGVSVEKIDSHTVRFTLRIPYAPFIENLTSGILPKHLWERIGPEQAVLHELNLKPVGSGPYEFYRFRQEKDGSLVSYEVRRNPNYHRGGPYLKKITFLFFKSEEELRAAWRKGFIDGFAPISKIEPRELETKRAVLLTVPMPRIFGIFLNEKQAPILAEKKVRESLAEALNKIEIAASASGAHAIPVDSPLPFLKTKELLPAYSYNPKQAKNLLETTGWKDADQDGIREKKGREKGKEVVIPLRFTLSTSDWPGLRETAELIKTSFREIGVEIAISHHSLADLESAVIRPRNFEMLLFGQVYGYIPDPFAFWHSSQIKDPGLNITLYANKKADQLLEEARRISDSSLREKKYAEFSSVLVSDLPAIFLYIQQYSYFVPADLKGINLARISLPADRFNEVNQWYRLTKRVWK